MKNIRNYEPQRHNAAVAAHKGVHKKIKILQYPPGGDKINKRDPTKINYFIERYALRKGTLGSFHIDFHS
ncbi:hypothetical protein [Pelosinus sp. HCF1]|uniref:hypothetical protein n=1 Tax=Pelosinus sp. HCF1 TaxID=1235479 RepID=UPI0002D7C6AD|nr:hypothetical protein [Pelosinus sp. HCF1]